MTSGLLDGLPVYLINLPRASDRRQRMEVRLAALGLPYIVIPGVDGKAESGRLLANTDIPAFRRNMGREILIGGLGCYHSHLLVWEQFLASSAEVALVLEDDIIFHDDFRNALELALLARDHWDLLKLNKIRAKLPISQGRVGPYDLMSYLGPNTGTGAYLVNRKTAAKLLQGMRRVTRATDHEINRYFVHDFRLRGLEPFPSHPEDGESLIAEGAGGYSSVKKFPWYKRLPNYRLRAANYFHRLLWMIVHNEIWPRGQHELTGSNTAPGDPS